MNFTPQRMPARGATTAVPAAVGGILHTVGAAAPPRVVVSTARRALAAGSRRLRSGGRGGCASVALPSSGRAFDYLQFPKAP